MTIIYPETLLKQRNADLVAAGNDFALYASHLLNCRYGIQTAEGPAPCTCGYSAAAETWEALTND